MQTFLPFENFRETAAVLDRQRLGKQRVECKQILRALHAGGNWKNHPAVRMWRGHTHYLIRYYYDIVEEWTHRGYKHNMLLDPVAFDMAKAEPDPPYWLGDVRVHERHRAMLVYKNPDHYIPIFRNRTDAFYQAVSEPGYYWPPPLNAITATVELDPILPF